MGCICRRYQDADLGALQHLIRELGYNVAIPDLERNIQAIATRQGAIFVAEMDGVVVGSVCAIIDARLAEGIYAEIVSLIVSEHYRKRSVGRKLVAYAESWSNQFVDKIRVRANVVRDSAHKFYASLGYDNVKDQRVFIKYL